MPTRAIRRFAAAAILALAIGAVSPATAPAMAQTLSADITDVFKRLADDAGGDAAKLSARDQALLFMNNDAINAAALNNEIGDDLYQAAQSHYARLNQDFGASAHEAGAQFTTQVRTSDVYSPGTDSDFITVVDDADQIGRIQENYNRRVNQYLVDNGVLDQPRSDWHNKLDTDFMADPSVVTDPEEFRKVAELNNDAYRRRMAAKYERLKRAKDGTRIGPEHVTEFAEEMADFSTKKGTRLDEMLKDPSQFNDPMKRAEAFRTMAQEQKYLARIEELEDILRAQEGLPPRPRGLSIAEQGSIRSPHNTGAIRDARAVAGQTRTQALQDLIETMGEVAHKNPQFAASAADDVARIIAKLPPGQRATAVGILRTRNAGLARQVDAALDAMPRGLGALDDAVHGRRVGRGRRRHRRHGQPSVKGLWRASGCRRRASLRLDDRQEGGRRGASPGAVQRLQAGTRRRPRTAARVLAGRLPVGGRRGGSCVLAPRRRRAPRRHDRPRTHRRRGSGVAAEEDTNARAAGQGHRRHRV